MQSKKLSNILINYEVASAFESSIIIKPFDIELLGTCAIENSGTCTIRIWADVTVHVPRSTLIVDKLANWNAHTSALE